MTRRRWVWVALLGAMGASAAYAEHEPFVRPWSAAVAPAMAAYQAGDFSAAQTMCQRILSGEADETTRFDAALLEVLCLLQEPTRAGRVEGRGRLAQMAQQDATLQDEAECNLALGVALRGLSETSEALERIDVAAQAFEKAQKIPRLLVTLSELARTWAAHTEWPMTPPSVGVGRPVGPAEQERVRRSQIEALRARAAVLPGSGTAVAEIDLALGQMLLGRPETEADGRSLLEKLTHAPLTETGAQAAWTLAQWHDQRNEVAAALALYRQIEAEGAGALQRDAAERVVRLTWPEVTLQVAPQAPPDTPVAIGLQVRGVAHVTVEVRRVDVRAWLANQRTRGQEMSLPLTGSVLLARTFDVPDARVTDAWDAAQQAGDALVVRGPVGAYVVAARGTAVDGRAVESRKLLFLSDLTVSAAVGQVRVALWTVTAPADQTPQLALWMQPSFVPTKATLAAGAVAVAWPNEARLARDRRWYALVEAGEHQALLRGTLAAGAPDAPEAFLMSGPPQVAIGDRLYVAGRLQRATAGDRVTLELRDVTDKLLDQKATAVGAGGALADAFDILPEYVGQRVQVRARLGERVVRNLGERMTAEVTGAQRRRLQVTVDAPPWVAAGGDAVRAGIHVNVPWGTPPAEAPLEYTIESLTLPDDIARTAAVFGGRLAGEARLDGAGTAVIEVPTAPDTYGLAEGPLALRVGTRVAAWSDAWRGVGTANILVASQRPQAWLECEPAAPVRGQPVQWGLGWFDSEGVVAADLPTVEILRATDVVARFHMHSGSGGLRSAPWIPESDGTFTARVTVPLIGAAPLIVERTFNVNPPNGAQADAGVWCSAQWDEARAHATTHVRGHLAAGWAALLVSDDEPLAVGRGAALEGAAEITLPTGGAAAPGAQVLIVAPRAAQPRVAAARVEAGTSPWKLALANESGEIWPGTNAEVRVSAEGAPPGTIVALVVAPAMAAGWLGEPDAHSEESADGRGLSLVGNAGVLGQLALLDDGLEPWSQTLREEVQPTWVGALALGDEPARVSIPVPHEAALYRLLGVARTPSGATSIAATAIDARRGVRLLVDVPPHWTSGDRGDVVATLTNAGQEAALVKLALTVGDGLHVDSWRVDDAPQGTAPQTLQLAAGQTRRVYAQVEAVQPGAGQVRLEVLQKDGRPRVVEAAYAVEAAETAQADTVRITRTLVAWRNRHAGPKEVIQPAPLAAVQEAIRRRAPGGVTAGQDEHVEHAHDHDDWEARIWTADQPLVPGEYLEVSERIEVTEPLTGVVWRQRAPFVAQRPVERTPIGLPQIGELERGADDEYRYRVPPRGPGVYENRYFMSVMRPGACLLPWPVLTHGDEPVGVRVEPAETRLVVTEGR